MRRTVPAAARKVWSFKTASEVLRGRQQQEPVGRVVWTEVSTVWSPSPGAAPRPASPLTKVCRSAGHTELEPVSLTLSHGSHLVPSPLPAPHTF